MINGIIFTKNDVGGVSVSTLEATVSMLEAMPEEARLKVYQYARTVFSSNRPANPFTPVSKETVLADLKASTDEFDRGEGMDAKEAIREMRRQRGFV